MSSPTSARAVADLAEGYVLATVEVVAPLERVFRALTSPEVADWWARPGVFDTREWSGDVRKNGRWRATGIGRGQPYALEGEFLELDPPRSLTHTWRAVGAPDNATHVSYRLEPFEGGTRVTLHHSGFASREACANTAIGWETSFEKLEELLGSRTPV